MKNKDMAPFKNTLTMELYGLAPKDSVTRRGRIRPPWPILGLGWPAKFGGGRVAGWPVGCLVAGHYIKCENEANFSQNQPKF